VSTFRGPPHGEDPVELRLGFAIDKSARAELETELFGKRILFSDKTVDEASTAQIVAEYRSQEAVEGDFRQMKDPKVVSFSPMSHFTESKIRVHVLYCVLALMVARLMVREAHQAGIHLSVRALLHSLAGSRKPSSSTRVNGDALVLDGCSPSTRASSATSTTSSASTPTLKNAEPTAS